MSELEVQVVDPPPDAVDALAEAAKVIDVDFAFVRHHPSSSGPEIHRRAVVAGIDSMWQRTFSSHPVDDQLVRGSRITVAEFYGHWFDPRTRRAKASGTMAVIRRMSPPDYRGVGLNPHHGPFVWLDEEDPEPFYLDPPEPDAPRGYAEAFFDPVHGGAGPSLLQAFLTIDEAALGSPGPDAEIYRWADDWHPYFDDGHEGWGSDAWTVRRDESTIVVIGASATD